MKYSTYPNKFSLETSTFLVRSWNVRSMPLFCLKPIPFKKLRKKDFRKFGVAIE
jgi:hypothetical protein